MEVAGSISHTLCMADSHAHSAIIGYFSGGHPTVGLLALIQKFVLLVRTRKPAESMLQTKFLESPAEAQENIWRLSTAANNMLQNREAPYIVD